MDEKYLCIIQLALQHEAYRDGLVTDSQSQFAETASAVAGHTQMALAMLGDGLYANEMLNHIYSDTNLQNDLNAYMYASQTGNALAFANYVDADYDSSADFWKLKMHADGSHEILFDGKKELSIDYLNERSEIISTSIPDNQDMSDVGMAGSLGKLLGVDRAEELLGSSYLNADNYDFNTLKDVLNLTDNQISKIQRSGSLEGIELTESQKYSLTGEALMKNKGAIWNGTSWTNTESISTTIIDGILNGNIMTEVQDGKYLYSTVNATLFRDPRSWNSVTSTDGIKWQKNTENYGLDSILYEKQGINYDYYDSLLVDKYQTVVNLSSTATDTPFYLFENNYISGNTIISDFNMGYYTNWEGKSYTQDGKIKYENNVLVLNNTKTISGLYIGLHGGENNNRTERWLEHDISKLLNNGSYIDTTYGNNIIIGYSAGCYITTRDNQKKLLQQLQNWNFTHGIQILGSIYNTSYADYLSNYPNTRGLR